MILHAMLCGCLPFDMDDNKEVVLWITKGELNFEEKYWNKISQQAKDLVKKLLCRDVDRRITA